MWRAYGDYWRNRFNFTGKTSVEDFWWVQLVTTILMFPTFLLCEFVRVLGNNSDIPKIYNALWFFFLGIRICYYIATVLPSVALGVRRIRDGGLSPWLYLIEAPCFLAEMVTFYISLTQQYRYLLPACLFGAPFTVVLVVFSFIPSRAAAERPVSEKAA